MKIAAKSLFAVVLIVFSTNFAYSQRELGSRPTESGGTLTREQAAFDVKSYDISARIFPDRKFITGETIISAEIVVPTNVIRLDLDTPYEVLGVAEVGGMNVKNQLDFKRVDGKIFVTFPMTKQPGEMFKVAVMYEGNPRVAPRAPWVGGFMWEKTADGSDWIAIAQQNDGSDIWYPSKDHPSDEADSVSLHITVPKDLYVATNGKLQTIQDNEEDSRTFNWLMSNPVNNYNVVLNIAPYKLIEDSYKSIAGETFPIIFYALPESAEKAKDIVEQTKKFLAFYEKFVGPYPYRAEKLGIAETPHLGMEHSTIIAYGNKFKNNDDGFDSLMLHELGHEWWGNLVTASDWRDFWIHEGFQSFMDTLYLEQIKGKKAYLDAMKRRAENTRNMQPVAPRDEKIAYQVYMAEPDYLKSDGDIYGKGSVVLHTLRYLIGDEAFFRALRRMAYPTKTMEKITTGKQSQFVTTDDFRTIAEEESKMKLDWFFEVYLRQPKLPNLVITDAGGKFEMRWDTPGSLPFPMPVEVEIGGRLTKIPMTDGKAELNVEKGETPLIDPNGWILKRMK
ncbi:MAG: M1 family metallopeptidase [Pyrinomonadaceae bacterium]|nr:M1 family metallopeptidase [Pyrinomonadaceae bacterium]